MSAIYTFDLHLCPASLTCLSVSQTCICVQIGAFSLTDDTSLADLYIYNFVKSFKESFSIFKNKIVSFNWYCLYFLLPSLVACLESLNFVTIIWYFYNLVSSIKLHEGFLQHKHFQTKFLFKFLLFCTWTNQYRNGINYRAKMALSESQCYTIINTPELSDVFNEMKIKKDLGEFGARPLLILNSWFKVTKLWKLT